MRADYSDLGDVCEDGEEEWGEQKAESRTKICGKNEAGCSGPSALCTLLSALPQNCGGPIEKFEIFFESEPLRKHLEITLDLKPKGKRRWPYGFEILKKFRYPWNYPIPPEYRDPPDFTEIIDLKKRGSSSSSIKSP